MIRIILLTLAMASWSPAATLLVPEDYATIQAGVDAAQSGDTVSVAAGTYAERVTMATEGVTLQSRTPQAATIDGGSADVVVTMNAPECTLDGFTITTGEYNTGMAISFMNSDQCVLRGNRISTHGGGGISVNQSTGVRIEGNIIAGHHSVAGSVGIAVHWNTSATVINNDITGYGIGVMSMGVLVCINNTIRNEFFACIDVTRPIFWNDETAKTVIENNILAGSPYAVTFTGAYAEDRDSYVAQYLSVDHNDLWQISEASYTANLGTNCNCAGCDSGREVGRETCGYYNGPFAPTPGTGELNVDPLFNGDGPTLQNTSPLIDAGANEAVPAGITTDLEGRARITNGTVDIGALEFTGPVEPQPVVSLCGAGITQAAALLCVCLSVLRCVSPRKRRSC